MKSALVGPIMGLVLAGSAHAQSTPGVPETENVPANADTTSRGLFSPEAVAAELEAARAWLQRSLVDYDSSRFMEVQVVLVSPNRRNRREVVLAVCGLVNARNRMGGYTGFQPFWFGSRLPQAWQGGLGGLATDVCGPANRLEPTDYSDRLAPRPASVGGGR